MNYNKAIIVGNVTQDPEIRNTPSGAKVANFSVATNLVWKDKTTGEKQQKTEFHNVVAWRGLADLAENYLNKGSLVLIEGRIETRSWEDQNSGQRRYRTEIIADGMQLGPRRNGGGGGNNASEGNTSAAPKSKKSGEEDIPTIDENAPSNSDDEVDIKDIPF
ncbi:MAG: single-stranded DNA-binding protein [Candidatus Spechtbacterales bacterium]|nr:single-stranded DNA-binding protein [Candidatus Spechtbacterales bacterium]